MKALFFYVLIFCTNIAQSQTNIFPTSGSVGIGTTSPAYKLDVAGPVGIGNGSVNTNNTKLFIRNTAAKTWAISAGLNMLDETTFGIYNWTDDYNSGTNTGTPFFVISYGGKVGIGTTSPNNILTVDPKGAGNISIGNSNTLSGSYTSLSLGISAQTNGYAQMQCIGAAGSAFGNLALNPSGGNILIGKTSQTNTGYKLDVNGNVRANKLVVNTTGADYVFDSSNKLLSLKEVEVFIQQNHHLPQIASATEMQANGIDLGENQIKLLQKTEELTLYIIQQNKTINTQAAQINSLQTQMNTLQEALQKLKDNKQ